MLIFKVFCVFLVVNAVQSAKILCLFPTPSRSHLIIAHGILTELAKHGHETTMVSFFPLGKTVKNYRDIVIKPTETINELQKLIALSFKSKFALLPRFFELGRMTLKLNNEAVQSAEFQKIANEEKFDLLFLGPFLNYYLVGYGAHFNCPIIMFNTFGTSVILSGFVGNPAEISYIPNVLYGVAAPMNFKQRLFNVIFYLLESGLATVINGYNSEMYTKSFGHIPNFPSYEDQKKNISLIFINDHFTQVGNRPLVQNMIEIGGVQIKESPDPLPEDIKNWMESNPNGVIYFSLGSNVKSTDLAPNKIQAILKTFEKLKQNVLWKYEDDKIVGLPKNVMIKKWLPQDDILTHTNLKLFITHGGLGSVAESKYHGVPVIVMPLFADQLYNAEKIVADGWGIRLDYDILTEESLYAAVTEIISNPEYKKSVQRWSSLYRDRPQTAKQAVVYWTNYVLRYRGAPHLQSNVKLLNFFQKHSFDTIGFILAVVFVALYIKIKILKFIIRFVIRKLTRNKNKLE